MEVGDGRPGTHVTPQGCQLVLPLLPGEGVGLPAGRLPVPPGEQHSSARVLLRLRFLCC